jgi:hypothetical protein
MKYLIKYILLFVVCLLLVDCDNDKPEYDFGEASYTPGFLWLNSETHFIDKTIKLDFSDEAKKTKSKAELEFVDENGHPLSASEYIIFIDGKKLSKPDFHVNASQSDVKMKISCTPGTKYGKKLGSLFLKSGHSLDRINDTSVEGGKSVEIGKWQFDYVHKMNPLAKGFMWFAIIFFGFILFWLLILKPIFYPRFGNIQKLMVDPGQSTQMVRFKGYRLVILCSKNKPQSFFDKIFKGKINYIINPNFINPIILKPKKNGRQALALCGAVRISPNPIPQVGPVQIFINNKTIILN